KPNRSRPSTSRTSYYISPRFSKNCSAGLPGTRAWYRAVASARSSFRAFNRLAIRNSLPLSDNCNNVPATPARKAVDRVLFEAHGRRRALLVMIRTKALHPLSSVVVGYFPARLVVEEHFHDGCLVGIDHVHLPKPLWSCLDRS